jgi:glycogen(starch) synthase
MKILMFGWEFPPHISGGLGTACYGLTHALLKTGTEVLFVVPVVRDSESEREDFLINASAVLNPQVSVGEPPQYAEVEHKSTRRSKLKEAREQVTVIQVPAQIVPYHHQWTEADRVVELTSWNYSFPSSTEQVIHSKTSTTKRSESNSQQAKPKRFVFSGKYGPDLMTEVERYADVADVIAEKYSFDAIHVHDWMTFPAGIKAKQRSGKPLIVHVHSTEVDRAGDHVNDRVMSIEKRGLEMADRIIAVSNWTKQILVSRYGVPKSKIEVIHNGILPKEQTDPYFFPNIASHFVTFLGRVTHQKGPSYFVEAARRVLREFPKVHFIVAGAGDLLPQMIERVAQLNMSRAFHFTGFLSPDQVDQIWSLTDVYVMPSVSEPFGIAPLEAIQGGVPVILSKQSGVSEVMPHAIKADFWDVDALAGAICSVLRYESLSNTLRKNSKKHIERLTWDKAAKNVNAIYHELTEQK